ncbi:MAG: hypothetical protein LCH54_16970 [Bacteroidetes bacterium]|nr:hypothetical protein [Bacteroidota bacterium]
MINIFVYYLLLALCISCNRQEIKNNIVEIKNDENRIYCFLSDKINTDMEKDKNQEIEEIYSDYYFHSKQLKNRINIEVQIFENKEPIFFGKQLTYFPNSYVLFVFVKKGDSNPRILHEIDTWFGLTETAKEYFGVGNIKVDESEEFQ